MQVVVVVVVVVVFGGSGVAPKRPANIN